MFWCGFIKDCKYLFKTNLLNQLLHYIITFVIYFNENNSSLIYAENMLFHYLK